MLFEIASAPTTLICEVLVEVAKYLKTQVSAGRSYQVGYYFVAFQWLSTTLLIDDAKCHVAVADFASAEVSMIDFSLRNEMATAPITANNDQKRKTLPKSNDLSGSSTTR